MPLILKKEDEPRWLETAENKASGLTELLMPYSADRMELWEVGPRVGRPGIDDSTLINQLERTVGARIAVESV